MNDKEKALDILIKHRVNISLLLRCFTIPEDVDVIPVVNSCRGLFAYNSSHLIPPGNVPILNIEEYLFLKEFLKNEK